MIYKAPSIYKVGGGSGGYVDGGDLVDGDLIKVENNSISTYTNTSRSDINYYFEVQDGEVLNAVIELTNEYNATVHIYILQNGFYIPLGNVGGDTVNAGDIYNILIVGNSFSLEQVVESNDNIKTEINGQLVEVAKIWNFYFTTENILINGDEFLRVDQCASASFSGGWRVPTYSELYQLTQYYYSLYGNNYAPKFKSTSGWKDGGNGDNSLKFNAIPKGEIEVGWGDSPVRVTERAAFNCRNGIYQMNYNSGTIAISTAYNWGDRRNLRLIHDV